MGVLACSRRECNNVMCDAYTPSTGYICNECLEEFKLYMSNYKQHITNDMQIGAELIVFMITKKNTYSFEDEITIDKFIENLKN